jgi:uncharacterized phage-associated protein
MPYDARQIANWFVTRSQADGRVLTIMSLLKLTYIAHGWHLETQDTPLFSDKIEAWQYGPVIPRVYNAFRAQGVSVTGTDRSVPANNFSEATNELLEQIWNIYGKLSAFRLSELTHVPGGPWDIATKVGGNYAHIPDELIQQHYKALRDKALRDKALHEKAQRMAQIA